MVTQPTGILSNLGLGILGQGGGILSPVRGTFMATFATTLQTFRANFNSALVSGLNAVYSARTSLTSIRFGVNALSALSGIKLITVIEQARGGGSSGGGSSGEGSSSGGSTGGTGEF
jgi:hypothetical protein